MHSHMSKHLGGDKRPLNSYMRFCQTQEKLENESIAERAKRLGQEWRNLSEQQKAPYTNDAKKALDKYNALPESQKNPSRTRKKLTKKRFQESQIAAQNWQPKKSKSGYQLYCAEERDHLKTKSPDLTFGEIGKELGRRWASLDPTKKNAFLERARKLKEVNEKNFPEVKNRKRRSHRYNPAKPSDFNVPKPSSKTRNGQHMRFEE